MWSKQLFYWQMQLNMNYTAHHNSNTTLFLTNTQDKKLNAIKKNPYPSSHTWLRSVIDSVLCAVYTCCGLDGKIVKYSMFSKTGKPAWVLLFLHCALGNSHIWLRNGSVLTLVDQ